MSGYRYTGTLGANSQDEPLLQHVQVVDVGTHSVYVLRADKYGQTNRTPFESTYEGLKWEQ